MILATSLIFYGKGLKLMEKFAEILIVAKQPVLKDHIMRKCSLSTAYFDIYINQLLESGMLNAYPALDPHIPGPKTRHRMIYQTSTKGIEFLKRYNELLTLMEIPLKYAPKLNFCGSRH